MQRIRGRRLEAGVDARMERRRLLRLGMDEQRPDADTVRDGCDLEQGVLEQGDQHYFADSSLPSYDPDATALLTKRVLEFLERV